MPPRNGYKSHRGRSAVARRTEFGGASGTNGIMPSVYVVTTTGETVRTSYFGGPKKGGAAPSATGFMTASGSKAATTITAPAQRPNFLFNFRRNFFVPPLFAPGTISIGRFGTTSFQLHLTEGKSFWHDIQLKPVENGNLYNVVIEVPMFSSAKMEMNKKIPNNPIVQDTKDGILRYYNYGRLFFNYGFIPKTWENPAYIDLNTGARGDGDPIDVIELGESPLLIGSVIQAKILGSLQFIDEGETDYKILMLRSTDSRFSYVNNMNDFEKINPGITSKVIDWLLNYKPKTADKPASVVTSNTPSLPNEAIDIVNQTHTFYNSLINDENANVYGYALQT